MHKSMASVLLVLPVAVAYQISVLQLSGTVILDEYNHGLGESFSVQGKCKA
jgi:hypothetical protein